MMNPAPSWVIRTPRPGGADVVLDVIHDLHVPSMEAEQRRHLLEWPLRFAIYAACLLETLKEAQTNDVCTVSISTERSLRIEALKLALDGLRSKKEALVVLLGYRSRN